MSGNVMSIGLTGLGAARAALSTVGHNIANVSTEGYTRQEVVLTAGSPQFAGAGFIGTGVQVSNVVRQFSTFLESQRLAVESQQGFLQAFSTQAQQVNDVLSDPNSGLSPALQDFFAGVQDVASSPTSVPSRQSMLSLTEALVARFRALDARFSDLRDGVNAEIATSVERINSLAGQIADINSRISSSPGGQGKPPNDLLDQRDSLVKELNGYVKVTTVLEADGSQSVFIGSGQSLVVGGRSLTLGSAPAPEDPENQQISLVAGSARVPMPTSIFQGGQLGGLLSFRDEMLDRSQNTFGRIAMVLAETFNAQHRLGQDLEGVPGLDYFEAPTPLVQPRSTNAGSAVLQATVADAGAVTLSDYRILVQGGSFVITRLPEGTQTTFATLPQTFDGLTLSLAGGAPAEGDSFSLQPTRRAAAQIDLALRDTARIAAAAPVRSSAALTNEGSARISPGVVSDTTGLPLPTPITLTYERATNRWLVTGAVPAAGPFTYTEGDEITFNGLSFTVSGQPADGDVLTVSNNTSGTADNRNALRLAQLQTTSTIAGGTTTYQGGYGQMVSSVGNRTREVEVQLKAQDALVKQATEAQQSFSGVNLDEEAANLVRYQQAYQASGKVLQIASQLFDVVLELGR